MAQYLTENSGLILLGMGAGRHADAQYLFTEDVCGYGINHKPRHGKVYAELGPKLQALRGERIAAFKAFRADLDAGGYPAAQHTVAIRDDAYDAFLKSVKG